MFFIQKGNEKSFPLSPEKSPKRRSFQRLFLIPLALATLLIWASDFTPAKTSDRERFEHLRERAEQGHVFPPEEAAELCSLWQVFYGGQFSGEECEKLIRAIRKRDLDSFKVAARPCLEELKAVYGGEITETKFKDGLILKFDTAATIMRIRFMHKSSGAPQYKTSKNKFRVQSGKYYLGQSGTQTSNEKSHFDLEGCSGKKIKDIIEKHVKWRRYRGKHLKK